LADHTITADEVGAYNLELTAGQPVTVRIDTRYASLAYSVRVFAQTGDSPVFARLGDQVAVADPKALIVPIGSWTDIDLGYTDAATISIVSEDNATVSVARQ
jgi:hypothetical protein